jgi:phospholipid/cholesterol/gamma-HCH transport system permease protein
MISAVTGFLEKFGEGLLFTARILKLCLAGKVSYEGLFDQIWKVFKESLPTTMVAGFFVGAIMTVQFSLQIAPFGALGYLGGLATSATIREVGPLLIAFLLSGKIGAFTAAELGTMKVTEQIDAIRCLGSDPLTEVIAPRFMGIIVASLFLLVFGLILSVAGGLLMGALFSGINAQEYLRHIPTLISSLSVFTGLIKCLCFSFVIASVCTYLGHQTTGGARGVGQSVIHTAVFSMVSIVVADWLSSFILDSLLRSAGLL